MNDFIKKNIAKYGLAGTNITPNPSWSLPNIPYGNEVWSKDNHFVWGYNGQEYNSRDSSTCMYWTDFGNPHRIVEKVKHELATALHEIYDTFGKFAIQDTNLAQKRIIAIAKENFVPHEVVSYKLDNKYIRDFAENVRNNDRETLLKVTAELCTDLPILYASPRMKITNFNYCTVSKKVVGPPNWALVDNERDTSINRWLMVTGRKGVPNIWRWSPEIMKSLFVGDRFMRYLNQNVNAENLDPFFADGDPILAPALGIEYEKSSEDWLTPLHRIIDGWEIYYNFDYGKRRSEEVYGTVK